MCALAMGDRLEREREEQGKGRGARASAKCPASAAVGCAVCSAPFRRDRTREDRRVQRVQTAVSSTASFGSYGRRCRGGHGGRIHVSDFTPLNPAPPPLFPPPPPQSTPRPFLCLPAHPSLPPAHLAPQRAYQYGGERGRGPFRDVCQASRFAVSLLLSMCFTAGLVTISSRAGTRAWPCCAIPRCAIDSPVTRCRTRRSERAAHAIGALARLSARAWAYLRFRLDR